MLPGCKTPTNKHKGKIKVWRSGGLSHVTRLGEFAYRHAWCDMWHLTLLIVAIAFVGVTFYTNNFLFLNDVGGGGTQFVHTGGAAVSECWTKLGPEKWVKWDMLSWGSFFAFVLCFCFESLHVCTDQKVNTNTNAWLTQMQMHTMRHYTTTV